MTEKETQQLQEKLHELAANYYKQAQPLSYLNQLSKKLPTLPHQDQVSLVKDGIHGLLAKMSEQQQISKATLEITWKSEH